jgi:hypothetical protein
MMSFTDDEVRELCDRAYRQGLSVEATDLFLHLQEDHAALKRVWLAHPMVASHFRTPYCETDGETWPCITMRAILGEGESDVAKARRLGGPEAAHCSDHLEFRSDCHDCVLERKYAT